MGTILIHEILHSFFDSHPDYRFLEEQGVSFYNIDVLLSLVPDPPIPVPWQVQQAASLYYNFLREYGDEVQKVFFGSEPDEKVVKEVNEEYERYVLGFIKEIQESE
jgi:hypothetical protein